VIWVNALLHGLLLGGLYALYGAGLSFMFGVMRVVNLAHGDFSVLAAFLTLVAITNLGLNPLVALIVVLPVMGVIGYLVQRALLNRSLRLDEFAPILVTFGLSIVIQNVLLEVFSPNTQSIRIGALATATIRLTNQLSVPWFDLLTMATAVVAIGCLEAFLKWTQTGRVTRATADNAEVARLIGANERHVFGLATAIAFLLVTLAGVMSGMRATFDPTTGPTQLLFAFEAVIIGGLGSIWGTLLGGIVLGIAQTIGGQISPSYSILAGHLVFLAVLMVAPQGLVRLVRARAAA
jgi:branched-chain amino acid transport system permease protein